MLDRLRNSPLHPQWFAFFRQRRFLRSACAGLGGIVLDIGCADARPKKYLPAGATYVGVDYLPTATEWYRTRPDLFADAQLLPLQDNSVQNVLLLDVLEHLPDPEKCVAEIQRVLVPGGTLVVQVPFLYPIHDAPLDFHRWTAHGLERAAEKYGLTTKTLQAVGHPVETAALNANIACSKTVLNWISGRNPLAITGLLLPFSILAVNCFAWLIAALSRRDDMMPYAYRMTLIKP